jgi:hypothetical protein
MNITLPPLPPGKHIVIKEFNGDMNPPCDPSDKDCLMKWLGSDSVMHVLKAIDPVDLPEGQDVIIYHDKDSKGKETKMVFNRVVVKKVITTKTETKDAKTLEADIYPNPSTGIFSIDVAIPGKTPATLEITDKSGKVLYAEDVQSSGTREVDLTAQGKGTYFLKLKQGKTSLQRKIMVN